jgi:chemotaxis protein MotA
MTTTPAPTLAQALRALPRTFATYADNRREILDAIISLAGKARRSGIVSLDQDLDAITDPFLQKALGLAVDGTDPQELRAIMDLEIAREESQGDDVARVYEAAGGYAPTIGIIGAVLGLIQVMKHLANIEEVGRGIAVAFVATVYGVGMANILLLPAASKLRAGFAQQTRTREMILAGVISITEGLNPRLIRLKLQTFLPPEASEKAASVSASQAGGKAPVWAPRTSNAPTQIP